MIPRLFLDEWRQVVPWQEDVQVEQDLLISRALVELYSHQTVASCLAFRGGTALAKLHFSEPPRYSEDIDLVQLEPGGIGPVLDAIRATLSPWLGEPKYKQTHGRVTLVYRAEATGAAKLPIKLKLEINTREHGSIYPVEWRRFSVDSRWFRGSVDIPSYALDELLGTKLRALYQRKKGRDLFDLDFALRSGKADPARIVHCFGRYMAAEGATVTRALFEKNLHQKRSDALFTADISVLLARPADWDLPAALERVSRELVVLLPGEPWAGEGDER
jgi:predicted nucleotidyltransferase component of viral defense system